MNIFPSIAKMAPADAGAAREALLHNMYFRISHIK